MDITAAAMAADGEGPVKKKLKYGGEAGDAAPLDEGVESVLSVVEASQTKLDKLNEKSVEEILQIERKYQTLRRPLYEERNAKLREVPKFWGTALQNHPILSPIILERDSEVLEHLTDLDVMDFEDLKSGFSIKLVFSSNPFFKNTELVKRICFDLSSGDIKTECTAVEWASADGAETVFTEDNSGFMNWFLTTEAIESSEDEVAAQIRDSVFVDPVKFFKGEVEMEEYGMYEVESDEEEDGEEDEGEEDGEEGSGEEDEEEEG